ncbi:DUF1294 domain-containing protein [Candidatus Vampirococcus lugosii]|uniref:DUF1294 domain-containing protein n=1 Tax=Candidatus Vampirococcus lugosii TaxID=2789015 RepID=UPI001BCDD875|nr:DUF1294 domain-containing protein [Candidatus Vampirococcus lugosii]
MYNILLYYFIFINLLGFILFTWDKYKSIKKQNRISEKRLLLLALIGGFIGQLISMILFNHKTRKTSFQIKLFLIVLLWIISIIIFLYFDFEY